MTHNAGLNEAKDIKLDLNRIYIVHHLDECDKNSCRYIEKERKCEWWQEEARYKTQDKNFMSVYGFLG